MQPIEQGALDDVPVLHQGIRGAIQRHQWHALKIDVQQFTQAALLAQPTVGGQFRTRRRHAPDNNAQDRRPYRAGEAQLTQQLGKLHLAHGPQTDLFNPYRAGTHPVQGY